MDEFDLHVFRELFRAVYSTCFGEPLDNQLTESESKHLSHEIEENTGLVIGWKSLKNYAAFILSEPPGKTENPSIATLDTLARYVFNAPATSEVQRKKAEAHFPYWFRYRESFGQQRGPEMVQKQPGKWAVVLAVLILLTLASFFFLYVKRSVAENIAEDFQSVDEAYLARTGWFVQAKEPVFWNRRGEKAGQLTLFTLKGDNWRKPGERPIIQNLLLRPIQNDCFTAEIHLTDFIPTGNWQQAGLLIAEDTTFSQKSIRLSLSYNDFFGGYAKPSEILIQAIASSGNEYANLEEFIHYPLFNMPDKSKNQIVANNLKHFAFRIEKREQRFRILYSASPVDNFSFKEAATYEFDMKPRFVGLFALKGFVDSTAVMPVAIRFFRLQGQPCH